MGGLPAGAVSPWRATSIQSKLCYVFADAALVGGPRSTTWWVVGISFDEQLRLFFLLSIVFLFFSFFSFFFFLFRSVQSIMPRSFILHTGF